MRHHDHDLDASDFYSPPKCEHCHHDLKESRDSFSHEFGTESWTEISDCPNGCEQHHDIDILEMPEYKALKEAIRSKLQATAENKLDFTACLESMDDQMEEAFIYLIDTLREEN